MASDLNIFARARRRLVAWLPRKSWHLPGRPILSLRRLVYLYYFKRKRLKRQDTSLYPPQDSDVPIDIFMPTIEKDAAVLPYTIDYARQNIKHPIANIYIVGSARSKTLKVIAKQKGCIFIDEQTILEIKKSDVNYNYDGFNKNGWIFKMLLNLNADSVCTQEHILILDSDTLFIEPQVFLHEGKVLFNVSDEYHQPYYDATKRIVGVKHHTSRSFITHYMLFEAAILRELRATIERRWNKPWDRAIIDNLDRSTAMAFADYECYADFYISQRPHGYEINYWSNASHELKDVDMDELIDRARKALIYRSVSVHTFKKQALSKHET